MERIESSTLKSRNQKLDLASTWKAHIRINKELCSDEIHVWKAYLNYDQSIVESLLRILTREEQLKSYYFHFSKDRKNYIVSHGLLRIILSRYLNREPNQIQFTYSQYGKPSLKTLSD